VRSVFTYANFDQAELLAGYILRECCSNEKKINRKTGTS
tara:strand:+ start:262 stop:378 length:117 start_codon:yes stop_codon:yes gene_type:complete